MALATCPINHESARKTIWKKKKKKKEKEKEKEKEKAKEKAKEKEKEKEKEEREKDKEKEKNWILIGDAKDKVAFILDDLVDSVKTFKATAEVLVGNGAKRVS